MADLLVVTALLALFVWAWIKLIITVINKFK